MYSLKSFSSLCYAMQVCDLTSFFLGLFIVAFDESNEKCVFSPFA